MRGFHSSKLLCLFLFNILPFILCLISVALGGGGGGFPEWGHLSKLGLGSGCSGPFGCPVEFVRRSVSGSTIVLEGIVHRWIPSSDVCLGRCRYDMLAGNYGVCRGLGVSTCGYMCSGSSL